VARQVLARGTPFAAHARPAVVNGGAGVVVAPGATPIAVVSFAIAGDRIAEIDVLADPERLRRIVPPLRR
jgi:RNA polymerase sigma-70 factor (ECF subfamily)